MRTKGIGVPGRDGQSSWRSEEEELPLAEALVLPRPCGCAQPGVGAVRAAFVEATAH